MIQDHLFLAWIKKFVCFPAGTPVVVGREGDRLLTRPIETLRAGDKVLARDEYGSAVGFCPIVAVSVRRAATLLHVNFRGSDEQMHTISCTPGHPFWVAERAGYVSADELLPGDTLSGPEGERLTFLSADRQDLPELIPVYNFEVAEAHTYFVTPVGDPATAVLVHNGIKCNGGADGSKKPLKDMSATERRAHFIAQGVPETQIGPSGYPKVIVVETGTLKEAEEAARRAGGSKPIKDTQDAGQSTHFHAVDKDGNKLRGRRNVHFQKRGETPNPD